MTPECPKGRGDGYMGRLGKRLEKRLQLMGSPVKLFSRQSSLGNGNSESAHLYDQGHQTVSWLPNRVRIIYRDAVFRH